MDSCHLCLGANWFNEHRVPNEQKWSKYVVDQWGTHIFPPHKVKHERQKIDRSKGEQGDNLRVEKSEVEWSEVGGLPQSQSNLFIHPSLCKNYYVGCPSIPKGVSFQGKEDLSCECQCTIAKLNTFTIANEQSGELGCFNSPMVVDHSLFKYNILFEDDEITPSDIPSGVDHDSSVVLDSYAFYSNLLWFEDYPPKDGNLFLEDESTLVGKDHDEKEGAYDDAHAFKWNMLLKGKGANQAKRGDGGSWAYIGGGERFTCMEDNLEKRREVVDNTATLTSRRPIGTSPNDLGDDPSSPNITGPSLEQDPSPTQWVSCQVDWASPT
ncbi:hypothetical protein KY289_016711 [Solanum tuberosum]|nr:hypothetical protein KY289_016711 [Solanum tuberosum]